MMFGIGCAKKYDDELILPHCVAVDQKNESSFADLSSECCWQQN
jgi:hypothetical protein